MLWAIPLSTKQKDIDFYYSFFDPQDHDVSAILAQLRLIGTERLKRKMYTLEKETYSEIKKLIKNLLD